MKLMNGKKKSILIKWIQRPERLWVYGSVLADNLSNRLKETLRSKG